MPRLSSSRPTRWAAGDGGLTSPAGSTMDEAAALAAMPDIGTHSVEIDGTAYEVERVSRRYCSVDDVRAAAAANNDGFSDTERYPDWMVLDAIQAAEEAIESGCRRSFCERAREIVLPDTDRLIELPEVDVKSISAGTLLGDRQALNRTGAPVTATMVYGARSDEQVRRACVQLASSYLRPRAGAENARGTSVDGVYVSFELATGTEGSWTGLPAVDACIASHRSSRTVIG